MARKRISVRMEENIYNRVVSLKEKKGTTINNMVILALEDYIEKELKKDVLYKKMLD